MAVYAVTYDSKSSYITNGKRYRVERDDGRGLFNIRSNRGTMLTCLWEGCAHLGTRGNWTRIEEEEQVTLLPGDYVSTEGMTEDQYHAVARAFMAAGAKDMGDSEYGRLGGASKNLGWDSRDDELWNSAILPAGFTGRKLTPAQVIGAVNAGSQQGEAVSDTLTQTLLDAAEHDAKAKHHAAEHDRLMQQARDMLPDGWMLVRGGVDWAKGEDMTDPANWREGDVIECIEESGNFFTAGKRYTILAPENPEEDDFDVIDDDNDRHAWDFAPAGKSFRFHSRPTT